MHPVRKPRWQQLTALVSLSASGAVTGLSLVDQPTAALRSPAALPVRLLAFERPAHPARSPDVLLRSAIVNISRHYLRMAQQMTPGEMEAVIWQHDSLDGADHGASCAAFASLTLELAAQAVGQQSWVTGGATYPWPLHRWADARVDPNPASPGIVSMVQDATAHHRWHPLGDGYTPKPGDWVLFSGHVEVVTGYGGGSLQTIGGDSMPNFSVNAHEYRGPLAAQGVSGFVNNGEVAPAGAAPPGQTGPGPETGTTALASDAKPASPVIPARAATGTGRAGAAAAPGQAAIPGTTAATAATAAPRPAAAGRSHYRRAGRTAPAAPLPATDARHAFIQQIADGAQAAQRQYGVPASVTIAQAIEESGWGQSSLAVRDHNLFGIKGWGPAGSDTQPTLEYQNGQWVSTSAAFRVYHSITESIADHGRLLASSGYYQRAMALRHNPDAFAAALTGVYATDPQYGHKLITLMRDYGLYRYDTLAARPATPRPAPAGGSAIPGPAQPIPGPAAPAAPGPPPGSGPAGRAPARPAARHSPSRRAAVPGTAPAVAAGPRQAPPSTARTASPPRAPHGPKSAPAQSPGRLPAAVPSPRRSGTGPRPVGGAGPAGRAGKARTPSRGSASVIGGPIAPGPRPPVRGRAPDAATHAARAVLLAAPAPTPPRRAPVARPGAGRTGTAAPRRYRPEIPTGVRHEFTRSARVPLSRFEQLYRDVAGRAGLPWQMLAACDWMQCGARARFSPVHGERLGSLNVDGTAFHTRSAALAQCADDLIRLAGAVYHIDLTRTGQLSVGEIAAAFAAFRWGALLRAHRTSPMEFPYSVAGLTVHHLGMRWPSVPAQHAADRPGSRFRRPFGAVPAVLMLNYPATA